WGSHRCALFTSDKNHMAITSFRLSSDQRLLPKVDRQPNAVSVDFPDPFTPTSAGTRPRASFIETSSDAWEEPYAGLSRSPRCAGLLWSLLKVLSKRLRLTWGDRGLRIDQRAVSV